MTHLKKKSVCAAIFACLAGPATAQGDWPTYGELFNLGQKLSDSELTSLFEGRSGIVSFSLGGATFGMIFSCEGEDSPIFEFDSGYGSLRTRSCEIGDSSICVGSSGDRQECYAIRRLDPDGPLYFGFLPDASEQEEEEEIAEYLSLSADILGFLPFDPRRLEHLTGEIDLGPVAFSIPDEFDFTFRQATAFPLGLAVGEMAFGGFRVNTEIVGWPDALSAPVEGRTPEPGDHDLARAHIAAWETSYRDRDLGGVMESEYELRRYEATPLEMPGGPCIRIREDIGVIQAEDGFDIQPALTAYFRQICIAPAGGALFLVTTALNDPEGVNDIADFEAMSLSILDSLRLGFSVDN